MEEIRRFVATSEGLQFQGRHRAEVYGLGRAGPYETTVRRAGQGGAWSVAALHGKDDWAEPGAGGAAHSRTRVSSVR